MTVLPATAPAKDLPAPTIFHEHWWLDIVSNGEFREATVTSDNRIVGRFPFTVQRLSGGRTLCGMPELTHFLGPVIAEHEGAACNRIIRQGSIVRELLDQMPVTSGFYHKMHVGISDMLAFQQEGYHTAVQFTHEVAPEEQATLWRHLRDKTRNVIRRAEEKLIVGDVADPAEFVAAYAGNLSHRHQRNHYREKTILRLSADVIDRGQGRILGARHRDGGLLAAILYVWDARRAYYLMTTRSSHASNGSVSLLIWRAIADCAARGLVFDFDGVAADGDILFFTGFGGLMKPRYIASRYSLRHRAVTHAINRVRQRKLTTFT